MHMYICVCHCKRATVDKQLWGSLAYKDGPELSPETIIRVLLMMSVDCSDVYVYYTCSDEITIIIPNNLNDSKGRRNFGGKLYIPFWG